MNLNDFICTLVIYDKSNRILKVYLLRVCINDAPRKRRMFSVHLVLALRDVQPAQRGMQASARNAVVNVVNVIFC